MSPSDFAKREDIPAPVLLMPYWVYHAPYWSVKQSLTLESKAVQQSSVYCVFQTDAMGSSPCEQWISPWKSRSHAQIAFQSLARCWSRIEMIRVLLQPFPSQRCPHICMRSQFKQNQRVPPGLPRAPTTLLMPSLLQCACLWQRQIELKRH